MCSFYRAMHSALHGIATVSSPSVRPCLYVRDVDVPQAHMWG